MGRRNRAITGLTKAGDASPMSVSIIAKARALLRQTKPLTAKSLADFSKCSLMFD
jgi:hypothetical protein